VKILDRTAVILEIFAQHAQSREGGKGREGKGREGMLCWILYIVLDKSGVD
jgi:hypothetical protein